FFFSSRRRHTRANSDWSSDVCSSDLQVLQLGALLEVLTVAKARAGIEKLVRLTPRTARRLTESSEETVPAEQVRVGDRLRVLPRSEERRVGKEASSRWA